MPSRIVKAAIIKTAAVGAILAFALAFAPVRAEPVEPQAARAFIGKMGDRAVAALNAEGDRQLRNDRFTRLMLDAIDFDAIAMATLGRMARTVSAKDKGEFTQLFAAYIIDVAIAKFGDTQMVKFALGEVRPMPNGDVKVHTSIDGAAGGILSADWRVHGTRAGLKINDIEVEGYSLVIHYRGEFERANVSTVPGLIAKLRELTKTSIALSTVRAVL